MGWIRTWFVLCLAAAAASAAMDMSGPGMGGMGKGPSAGHGDEGQPIMPSSLDPLDPMSREGSGTSWVPDSSPTYGRMLMFGRDMLMLHGAAWPRYTNVGSRRGNDRVDAPSWFMAMFRHPLSRADQLGARLMLSLDPALEGERGYPLLYQSGESAYGQPLHDRQHPHDLVGELSASYAHAFGRHASAYLYFGYPGEPALGPPTFMHRLSAMDMPDAPIGHHWQDSTHITFGVLTGGVSAGPFKLEGSWFNGREPDEDRYDFDALALNSVSGRLSWNPTRDLALQVSHGYIKSPEQLTPTRSVHRTTASVLYNLPLGRDSNWANALVWGQNVTGGEGSSDSWLLESTWQARRETVYLRLERVAKSGDELVLGPALANAKFNVGSYTLGYLHDVAHGGDVDLGLGVQGTLDTNPSSLNAFYGGTTHGGFEVFVRLRPSRNRMRHGEMGGMAGMGGMTGDGKAQGH